MSKLKKIIMAGLLLALTIVLSRFLSIKTPIMTVSFSFVPIMLSAIWLGPKFSMLVAALADLIGAILFPFGAYFPGYTLSAALSGLTYGLLLHEKEGKKFSNKQWIIRLLISSAIVAFVINGGLNSLWIWITSKKAIMAILPARMLKELMLLPLHVVVSFALMKAMQMPMEKYIRSNHD